MKVAVIKSFFWNIYRKKCWGQSEKETFAKKKPTNKQGKNVYNSKIVRNIKLLLKK